MKKIFYLLLILPLLMSSSCKKDPVGSGLGDIKLNFKAFEGSNYMLMNEKIPYGSYEMFYTRFHTFISDITLIGSNGETKILEIGFVDFTDIDTEGEAALGKDVLISAIPAGEYTAIRIGLGLSPAINSTTPSDHPSSSPLSKTGEYWEGWSSYIFSKLEGKMDKDDNGSYERSFIYHMGSDAVFRTKTFTLPLSVKEDDTLGLNFNIDVVKLADGVDLSGDDGTHSLGDIGISTIIMDNFAGDALIKE